ncbi:MAG TPA: hypothetical protein VFB82_24145 [Blastocatellia bacterium]|nr:hypothetical protein [Blastocatellia bacterium]
MTDIDWAGLLDQEDVESLWNGLYQLVSRHPGVRPLHFATDSAAVSSQTEINADLAQELFLELFQKRRFDHYLNTGYTSSEIESELARIEVPNLVGARLRKRYPESFRMARRVSSLLKTSDRFCRISPDARDADADSTAASDKPKRRGRPKKIKATESGAVALVEEDDDIEALVESGDEETAESSGSARSSGEQRRGRMVNQVYGLREWRGSKPVRDSGLFGELAKSVPIRRRDTRLVGRTGTSQLILSNPDLEELIVEVLKAIDSPADVRTIRQLVLSKIPLQDYNVSSLDEELSTGNEGSTLRREARDTRDTPEDALLRDEQDDRAAELASEFLVQLRRVVNNNERRYERLLSTLWYCYYDSENHSQLEIARRLGVSDSLVSDSRKLIEHELRKLKLSVEEGAVFSESLERLVAPVAAVH